MSRNYIQNENTICKFLYLIFLIFAFLFSANTPYKAFSDNKILDKFHFESSNENDQVDKSQRNNWKEKISFKKRSKVIPSMNSSQFSNNSSNNLVSQNSIFQAANLQNATQENSGQQNNLSHKGFQGFSSLSNKKNSNNQFQQIDNRQQVWSNRKAQFKQNQLITNSRKNKNSFHQNTQLSQLDKQSFFRSSKPLNALNRFNFENLKGKLSDISNTSKLKLSRASSP